MVTGAIAALPAVSGAERTAGPRAPEGPFGDVLREVLAVGGPSTLREPAGQHGKVQGQTPWHGIGLASLLTPPLPVGTPPGGHVCAPASSGRRVGLAAHAEPESYVAGTSAEPSLAVLAQIPAAAATSRTTSSSKVAAAVAGEGAEGGPHRMAIETTPLASSAAERPANAAAPAAKSPGLAALPAPAPAARRPSLATVPAPAARSAAAAKQVLPAAAQVARLAGMYALASPGDGKPVLAEEPPRGLIRAEAGLFGHGTSPATRPERATALPALADGVMAKAATRPQVPVRHLGGPAPAFKTGMQSLRHGSRAQAGFAGTRGESGRPLAVAAEGSSPVSGGASPAPGSPLVDSAQVAAQVAAAAQRAMSGMQSGPASVRLQLNPADLGHVQITLRTVQNGVMAVLRADNPAAIAVLQAGQDDLRQRLGALGFKASTVEIMPADRPRIVGAASRSPSGRRSG